MGIANIGKTNHWRN